MHEILFRGRRVDSGGWHYGGYFKAADGTTWVLGDDGISYRPDAIEVIPKTVGQYTGMFNKDRTKKIYDGDIVHDGQQESMEVFWNQLTNGWWFRRPEGEGVQIVHKVSLGNLEVVGNIHDNPEFLLPLKEVQ